MREPNKITRIVIQLTGERKIKESQSNGVNLTFFRYKRKPKQVKYLANDVNKKSKFALNNESIILWWNYN